MMAAPWGWGPPFMANDAPDTITGGFLNFLGNWGFIVPLVGFEELIRRLADPEAHSLPYSVSSLLMVAGLPLSLAPAIWKRWSAGHPDSNGPAVHDLRSATQRPLQPSPPSEKHARIMREMAAHYDVVRAREALERDRQAARAPAVSPKISVQDAMLYIVNRVWPGQDTKLLEGQSNIASDALQALREAAGAERLTIWGIEYNGQLPFPIPPDFWTNHQIDYMTAIFADSPESVKTESAISFDDSKRYKNLLVSVSEVEALWPPA